mgnify:CR=1 FL=1
MFVADVPVLGHAGSTASDSKSRGNEIVIANDAQKVIDDRDHVEFAPGPLDRSSRFYVAGHRGLVGSAIWRRLEAARFTDIVGRSRSELALQDRESVFAVLA